MFLALLSLHAPFHCQRRSQIAYTSIIEITSCSDPLSATLIASCFDPLSATLRFDRNCVDSATQHKPTNQIAIMSTHIARLTHVNADRPHNNKTLRLDALSLIWQQKSERSDFFVQKHQTLAWAHHRTPTCSLMLRSITNNIHRFMLRSITNNIERFMLRFVVNNIEI